MKFMQEQALEGVLEGITTLDEVQRVVPLEEISSATCPGCQFEVSARFSFCPRCGQKGTVRGDRKLEHALEEERAMRE